LNAGNGSLNKPETTPPTYFHHLRYSTKDGVVSLTPATLSMLLEGIDWRNPQRTWRPEMAG